MWWVSLRAATTQGQAATYEGQLIPPDPLHLPQHRHGDCFALVHEIWPPPFAKAPIEKVVRVAQPSPLAVAIIVRVFWRHARDQKIALEAEDGTGEW